MHLSMGEPILAAADAWPERAIRRGAARDILRAMDFGFGIPTRGVLATQEAMLALAKHGEQLGFAYLALPDHIVIPRSIASPYPYNDARKMAGAADGDCFEQLAVLAYLAAATQKIRLLTSVMVVPHRPPVFTAKALATIDVLSNGRVAVGVGAGWMDEEFRAIGAPPFAERGKVTDEYLRIFKTLWTQDDPRYEGQYASFGDVSFLPKPLQKPHPPIWVGGESPAALRRVIALGDAWYPIGINPQFPLNTVERFGAAIESLRADAARAKRDPNSIALTYWAPWYKEAQTAIVLEDGQRQVFTGTDAHVAHDIDAFRALGVRHLLFSFVRANLSETLTAMERFVAKVIPLASV
jgi:probable F420-dependent oxidoreductase